MEIERTQKGFWELWSCFDDWDVMDSNQYCHEKKIVVVGVCALL